MSGLFTTGMYELAGGVLTAGCAAGWVHGRFAGGGGGARGMAARGLLNERLSLRAVRAAAAYTRPELTDEQRRKAPADQVGVSLGFARGGGRRLPLHATHEDTLGIIGPPRSGKTLALGVSWTLDAPGALVCSSTVPDLYKLTAGSRTARGPVLAFDPERLLPAGAPRLRWNPVAGCTDPQVAIRRAKAMMAVADTGGTTNSEFFTGSASDAVRCLLHAAALGGRSMADVRRWAFDPDNPEPYQLLRSSTLTDGWEAELRTQLQGDPRTRNNVVRQLARGLTCLADPAVLESVCPPAGEEFDVTGFLTAPDSAAGSVYVLTGGAQHGSAAALATGLVDELITVGRQLAAHRPAGRLDPPLSVVLDELANGAPLPELATYLATGGGRGIHLAWMIQDLGQLRSRWGDDQESTIISSTTGLIVLGGLRNAEDLRRLSELAGERDDFYTTRSRDNRTGAYSTSGQVRRVPVLPVEVLRGLPPGQGVLYYRNLPPAFVRLPKWTRRPDAAAVRLAGEAWMARCTTIPAPADPADLSLEKPAAGRDSRR